MSSSVSAIFDRAREMLEREGRRLDALSQGTSNTTFDHDGFDAIGRALSFVVMGGVLEEWMREISTALAADVLSMSLERRHLPVSLIAAVEAAAFRQCGSDKVGGLMARANVLASVVSHADDVRPVSDFGGSFSLADGSTVSDRNFQALWMLLELSGDWRNQPTDSMLIREIRDKRNDVAHWNEDPVEIGRKKRPSDLRAMITQLMSLLDHIELNMLYWFEERTA